MPPDLSSKTRGQCEAIRTNAERTLADPARAKHHAAAHDVLAQLGPAPAGGRRTHFRAAETEAVGKLTQLAREVETAFDLSPPPDTRHVHRRLAAADGSPKVGGRQRRRVVAVDRYISHRRGDSVAAISWVRGLDEDTVTGGHWYVSVEVTWYLQEPPPVPSGEQVPFEEAREAFLSRLDAIGTPRKP